MYIVRFVQIVHYLYPTLISPDLLSLITFGKAAVKNAVIISINCMQNKLQVGSKLLLSECGS